jgi:phosphatidate cytidylyltransferase
LTTTASSRFKNLTQRLITGILGAAGIIFGIVYSEWTYYLVFLIICVFSLLEFYRVIRHEGITPVTTLGLIGGVLIYTIPFLVEKGDIPSRYYFIIFPLTFLIFLVKLYKKEERKPFTNIGFTFLGMIYLALPLALLHFAVYAQGTYNYEIIFGCLFILWATDTGAYFAGTYLGKHKLFERISPKKSWEGVAGGAVLALVFAYGISVYFTSLALWQWMGVYAIIVVGGVFGDLVESMLKRSIEIKDSGSILPGHGGFLDRFDGLFISAPFVVAFLKMFN